MKEKLILSLCLLFTSTSFAGQGSGNGGVVHVCKDKNGAIESVELLDLWKGKKTYPGIEYTSQIDKGFWRLDGGFLHYDGLIANRLAPFEVLFSHYTNLYAGVHGYRIQHRNACEYMQYPHNQSHPRNIGICPIGIDGEEYRFLFVERDLLWSGDSEPGTPEESCEFQQLGYYTDEGVLLINKGLFHKMNSLNKSAFFTHEFLYRTARIHENAENSVNIQKIVAQLYKKNFTENLLSQLIALSFPSLERSIGPAKFHKINTKYSSTKNYYYSYAYELGVDAKYPVKYKISVSNPLEQNGFQLLVGKFERDNQYEEEFLNEKFVFPFVKSPIRSGKNLYEGVLPLDPKGLEGLFLSFENTNARIKIDLFQNDRLIGHWNNLEVSKVVTGQNNVLRFVLINNSVLNGNGEQK